MMPITRYAILALFAGLVVMTLATFGYRSMYKATAFALSTQNAAIKSQNEAAAKKLKLLTEARDATQLKLDALAQDQNEKDKNDKKQVAVDSAIDSKQPIRVRVIRETGCSRDSGAGQATAVAPSGNGSTGVSGGILAPEAQQLVVGDRDAVEQLQIAFNSCVARLTGTRQ